MQHTITGDELVDQLAERGYGLRRLASPGSAGVAVRAATNQFLDGARARLIQQRLVPREAAKTLLARLGEAATDCVLTGRAGSGKTACIVEAVTALRKRGVPVLAFRLDRFLSVSTTAELGRCLELEESPVLVLAAAAAAGSPAVLIVESIRRCKHSVRSDLRRFRPRRAAASGGSRHASARRTPCGRRLSRIRLEERSAFAATHTFRGRRAERWR